MSSASLSMSAYPHSVLHRDRMSTIEGSEESSTSSYDVSRRPSAPTRLINNYVIDVKEPSKEPSQILSNPQKSLSLFEKMPDDHMRLIFKYLDFNNLARIECLSTSLKNSTQNIRSQFWSNVVDKIRNQPPTYTFLDDKDFVSASLACHENNHAAKPERMFRMLQKLRKKDPTRCQIADNKQIYAASLGSYEKYRASMEKVNSLKGPILHSLLLCLPFGFNLVVGATFLVAIPQQNLRDRELSISAAFSSIVLLCFNAIQCVTPLSQISKNETLQRLAVLVQRPLPAVKKVFSLGLQGGCMIVQGFALYDQLSYEKKSWITVNHTARAMMITSQAIHLVHAVLPSQTKARMYRNCCKRTTSACVRVTSFLKRCFQTARRRFF